MTIHIKNHDDRSEDSDADSRPAEDVKTHVWKLTWWDKRLAWVVFLSTLTTATTGALSNYGFFQSVQPPGWMRLIGLFSGVVLGFLVPIPKPWTRMVLDRQTVTLETKKGERKKIPAETIRVIVHERGLDLSGGEMVVYKNLVLCTETQTFRAKIGDAPEAVADLTVFCPDAVLVLEDEAIRVPRWWVESSLDHRYKEVRTAIQQWTRAVSRKNFIAVSACILTSVTVLLLIIASLSSSQAAQTSRQTKEAAVFIIVPFIAGILLFFRGVNFRRFIRKIEKHLDSEIESPTLVTKPRPPGKPQPIQIQPSQAFAWIFMVFSVLTLCLPGVNVVLALVAVYLSRKRSRLLRRTSMAVLVVAIVFSLLHLILFLFA